MIQKTLTLLAGLLALAVLGFAAAPAGDTVNDKCPISQQAVDGKTTSTVGDHEVGFCCGRCKGAFDGWDKAKQVAFVERAGGAAAAVEEKPAGPASAPYLLDVCAVSGEKLGSMGDPITETIEGREVKFCCKGCVGKYKEDSSKFTAKIDRAMMAQQERYWPMDTCIISGEPLGDDPKAFIVGNRLMKTCCGMCAKKVQKNPAEYIAKVEAAQARKQGASYPTTKCAVSGEELGSMGDPIDTVVAGRLVRLCCKGCTRALRKDPAKVVAAVDRAWAAKAKK